MDHTVAHGQGVLWNNTAEAKYDGTLSRGKKEGRGIETLPSYTYEGEFKQDHRNGRGRLTVLNGITYVGEFQNDRFEGDGVLTFTNGKTYSGKFADGKFNGKGVLRIPGEGTHSGFFTNNKPHGSGKFVDESGVAYIGMWKNGVRNGIFNI
jgi:hypothetical protein